MFCKSTSISNYGVVKKSKTESTHSETEHFLLQSVLRKSEKIWNVSGKKSRKVHGNDAKNGITKEKLFVNDSIVLQKIQDDVVMASGKQSYKKRKQILEKLRTKVKYFISTRSCIQ